jgi:hypothetical protein
MAFFPAKAIMPPLCALQDRFGQEMHAPSGSLRGSRTTNATIAAPAIAIASTTSMTLIGHHVTAMPMNCPRLSVGIAVAKTSAHDSSEASPHGEGYEECNEEEQHELGSVEGK